MSFFTKLFFLTFRYGQYGELLISLDKFLFLFIRSKCLTLIHGFLGIRDFLEVLNVILGACALQSSLNIELEMESASSGLEHSYTLLNFTSFRSLRKCNSENFLKFRRVLLCPVAW